jgi:hypothetical protein
VRVKGDPLIARVTITGFVIVYFPFVLNGIEGPEGPSLVCLLLTIIGTLASSKC